jgi:subtilisin family serine protease
MSRKYLGLLIAAMLLACAAGGLSAAPAQEGDQFMVLFKGSVKEGYAIRLIERAGGTVVRGYYKAGIVVAQSSDPNFDVIIEQDRKVEDCGLDAKVYGRSPDVLGSMEVDPTRLQQRLSEKLGPVVTDPTTAILYDAQWNLQLIEVPGVWKKGLLGDPGVTVAILDTGVDYLTPDLVGKIDLDRSVSFVPSDDILVEANFPGAHPIADLHIHGTFVAALIGCNSIVLACVSPNVDMFAVKVVSGTLVGSAASITSGLLYAEENGADVIALSIDAFMSRSADSVAIRSIRRAINFVARKGVHVVGEIGGDDPGIDLDTNDPDEVQVPGEITNRIIGLSASGPLDEFSDFSNFGVSAVDMTAPGGFARLPLIENSIVGPCSRFTLLPFLPNCGTSLTFVFLVGPFISVAEVAGTVALIDEQTGGSLGWRRMRNRVLFSADDIGDPGFDAFFGIGRLNTLAAIQAGE